MNLVKSSRGFVVLCLAGSGFECELIPMTFSWRFDNFSCFARKRSISISVLWQTERVGSSGLSLIATGIEWTRLLKRLSCRSKVWHATTAMTGRKVSHLIGLREKHLNYILPNVQIGVSVAGTYFAIYFGVDYDKFLQKYYNRSNMIVFQNGK